MTLPKYVKIVEVGPRDGLQNEKNIIPITTKIEFINRLSETGLSEIEVGSFVSPKWIPQLADSLEVVNAINKKPGVHYSALVPNVIGLEHAIAAKMNEVAVFTTPSEQFSKANTHCSVAESLSRITEVLVIAKKYNLRVRGYISCVLGCPYEGDIKPEQVLEIANFLYREGCHEVSLGDTIGVGTPVKTKQLIEVISKQIPHEKLAVHMHDTYGQALVNCYAALESGISIIDSSVSGLGGCPYAKGASGNVATEDVLYMLHGMGIETGVDLQKVIKVGEFISNELGRETQSKVGRVMMSSCNNISTHEET